MLYRTLEGGDASGSLERFSKSFETINYTSQSDMISILKSAKIDMYYKQSFRTEDMAKLPVFSVGHAVFDYNRPFGNVWAYISRWLAYHASGGRCGYVPYIVEMPEADGNLREGLGIPEDATVIGRYGGMGQFDIPFVHRAVMDVLEKRKDIYFLFANTQVFGTHERIIYVPVIHSPEEKARFIATCDYMLHARYGGESFGLAMAEFLLLGCPVMCWAGGSDRNHLAMQPNKELIYRTYGDLHRLLMSVRRDNKPSGARQAIEEFSPENVWRKWESVFIKMQGGGASVAPIPARSKLRRKIHNRVRKGVSFLYSRI
jgi:hypothetical protein